MPIEALLAVLAAAMLHAGWNAMAKGGAGDPLTRSFMIAVGSAATALPCLLLTGLPALESWVYVAASAIIHLGYFTLIGLAYRYADYSAVYPLIRGGAPLFTSIIAALLLGEALQPLVLCGIALLCGGIVGLGSDAIRRGGLDRRSITVAALTAGIVVSYTLVDGVGARASGNPAAFLLAMMGSTGLLVLPVALTMSRGAMLTMPPTAWGKALLGGAMANLSYGTALWAMTLAPIGLVAAIRETSVLFATLIGAAFLKERFGKARWLSAATIVAGLALTKAAS